MYQYVEIETHLSTDNNIMDTNQSSIFLDEKICKLWWNYCLVSLWNYLFNAESNHPAPSQNHFNSWYENSIFKHHLLVDKNQSFYFIDRN